MTYGSLINMVMSGSKPAVPEVGMGATILMWSDRHAGTIIEVQNTKAGEPKRIVVQEDKAKRTDSHGMSDSQSYEYEADPTGTTRAFTKRKNGAWISEGSPMRGGTGVLIGHRDHHYDYSF